MKETNLFKSFFESEKAGGIILIFATLIFAISGRIFATLIAKPFIAGMHL
jgi:Na+/H+ antiporter NhaA